jgi:DNA-binding response OmpR family regulator
MWRLTVHAMAAVLVIEDDQRIREVLARGLTAAGHAVRTEATGGAALAAAVEWKPDVVVLDLGLPDLDGRDVLRMLRGVSAVPVIVATARDDEAEIVQLLDAGADDYVVKPYATAQIEARIRAVLRRSPRGGTGEAPGGGSSSEIRCGDLVVDPARRTARLDGRDLDLTRLEFDLLACLARRSPEVVTRRELLAEVWRQPYGGTDKTVDVHLSWLRRKLGETASEPRYIHTVRGVGIKLDPPPATPADAPTDAPAEGPRS